MDGKFLILIFLGLFLVDSTDGISGGTLVPEAADAFAAIYNSRHDYICTGTIISTEAVVTSASCLGYYADFNKSSGIHDKHRLALFARVFLRDRRNHTYNHHIKELVKHPLWDYDKPQYDCAIIKPHISFDWKIAFVMSFPRDGTNIIFPGLNVSISGWGASRENFPNEYIMHIGESFIISKDECQEKYPDENLDDELFFCTHQRGSGACSGDDGGPVIVKESKDHKSKLAGIIGYRKGCGYPEYPDIHVNIYSVLDFIEKEEPDIARAD